MVCEGLVRAHRQCSIEDSSSKHRTPVGNHEIEGRGTTGLEPWAVIYGHVDTSPWTPGRLPMRWLPNISPSRKGTHTGRRSIS